MLRIFNLLDYILHLKSFKLQIHSCFLGNEISNKLYWLLSDLKIRILNTWSQVFAEMQKIRRFWNVKICRLKLRVSALLWILMEKNLHILCLNLLYFLKGPLRWCFAIVKSHINLLENLNTWLLFTYVIGPINPVVSTLNTKWGAW